MTLLVVMGSGETAPAMVKTHRDVLRRTPDGPALMLDTPFAFQDNAADLTARTRGYFSDSVGRVVEVAHWSRADAPAAEQERALSALASASWVFAGPGSPTYALRQWIGTSLPGALTDVAERGGTLVLGSAAAVTVGTHAIPVYEIYKVGEDPRWVPGLDLLGSLTGIHAVVVPHYDNAEGGSYDTRFCYLGEKRLAALEQELPDEVGVLGVDEHTALVVDVAAGTAEVTGSGGVTVRRRGANRVLPAGTSLPLADLAALLSGADLTDGDSVSPPPSSAASGSPTSSGTPGDRPDAPSLRAETDRARTEFDAALEARDAVRAAASVLALEEAITAWSADTLQGEDRDRARRALRSMVVRLGDLATDGVRDPRETLAPYLQLLLELRGQARAAKDFATSDLVRDRLVAAGVTVQDTPDGPTWALT